MTTTAYVPSGSTIDTTFMVANRSVFPKADAQVSYHVAPLHFFYNDTTATNTICQ